MADATATPAAAPYRFVPYGGAGSLDSNGQQTGYYYAQNDASGNQINYFDQDAPGFNGAVNAGNQGLTRDQVLAAGGAPEDPWALPQNASALSQFASTAKGLFSDDSALFTFGKDALALYGAGTTLAGLGGVTAGGELLSGAATGPGALPAWAGGAIGNGAAATAANLGAGFGDLATAGMTTLGGVGSTLADVGGDVPFSFSGTDPMSAFDPANSFTQQTPAFNNNGLPDWAQGSPASPITTPETPDINDPSLWDKTKSLYKDIGGLNGIKGAVSIGSGLYGLYQQYQLKKQADQAAKNADPWGTSGGRAAAGTELSQFIADPSTAAANDPSYQLRLQAAARASAPYGQGSGQMAVGAANASTSWYNDRLAQLGQLAGTGNAIGAGQLGLQGTQAANTLAGQSLGSIGYGITALGGGGGTQGMPPALQQQLALWYAGQRTT